MSDSFDFHDQDFNYLEAQLDNLPPARQYAPFLASTFAVWLLGRKLAKLKKHQSGVFSEKVTVEYRQPLSSSSGWVRFDGDVSREVTDSAKRLVTDKFDRRGLSVSDFKVHSTGTHVGLKGAYRSLSAQLVVT